MLSWDGPMVEEVPTRDRLTAAAIAGDHAHDWTWAKVRMWPNGQDVSVEWVSRWTVLKWGIIMFLVGTEAGALVALAINTWRHP